LLDPIGSFQRIRELYLTYLETAFRIREKSVSKERRDLLLQPGTLCTEPLLEPMSLYETAGYKVDQLVTPPTRESDPLAGFTPAERAAFVELAKAGLLDTEVKDGVRQGKYPLYLHQVEMLGRGTRPGQPGVVTSGTGSGKTESFLLPIFAMLAKEALRWEAPAKGYLRSRWWHDENGKPCEKFTDIDKTKRPLKQNPDATPFVPHRAGEHASRVAAVRALILYPMNALVEDQLVRLRKALDSDAARAFMDAHFKGNRLFLGRYTSSTPVTGFDVHPRLTGKDEMKRRHQSLEKLFYRMVELERTQVEVRQWKGAEDDSRFLFPSVDGAELNSRWDMQQTPPDILITNVSMLNAMLAREVDAQIFTRTREWLEEDENAYFFLVLDELHLQRGAEGTEVAYLLRLLLERLGLTRPELRHKLRILASSASLPMDGEERDKSLGYLWGMFGHHGTYPAPGSAGHTGKEDWASAIVTGKAVREAPRNTAQDFLATEPFKRLLEVHGATDDAPVAAVDPRAYPEVWQAIAQTLLGVSATGSFEAQVRACVQEAALWLARACWPAGSPSPRAQMMSHLASPLFGGTSDEHLRALRGLLLVRGMGDELDGYFGKQGVPTRIPSFRLHTFFRSIEGLFAPAHPRAGVADAYRSDTRPVGALTVDRGLRFVRAPTDEGIDGKPLRLFEVLYCECCGELFFGGMRGERDVQGGIELLPSEPQLDGLPDAAASQRFEDLSSEEFAVFWPTRRAKPEDPSDKE
jgi:DEAD/DEAH box helicase domain-containing protein